MGGGGARRECLSQIEDVTFKIGAVREGETADSRSERHIEDAAPVTSKQKIEMKNNRKVARCKPEGNDDPIEEGVQSEQIPTNTELSSLNHANDVNIYDKNTGECGKCRAQICNANPEGYTSCSLCSAPNERLLKMKGFSLDGVESTSNEQAIQKIAIGCNLITYACFPKLPSQRIESLEIAIKKLSSSKTKFSLVQNLLLKVAAKVPSSVWRNVDSSQHKKNQQQFSFLRKPYLSAWIHYVMDAVNSRMLSQAFVTLISSMNRNKMPKWWQASRCGWLSTTIWSQNALLSALAMQIYVLDLALAEVLAATISPANGKVTDNNINKNIEATLSFRSKKKQALTATSRNNKPFSSNFREKSNAKVSESLEKLQKMNIKTRVNTLQQWASKLSLKPFDGETNNMCEKCNKGGSLMCCEFCNTVIHVGCCDPPLRRLPDHAWICDPCTADINTLSVEKFN